MFQIFGPQSKSDSRYDFPSNRDIVVIWNAMAELKL